MGKVKPVRKNVKVTAAWMDGDKLRCHGVCDDINMDFVAAVVGEPDQNKVVWTRETIKFLLADIKSKIKHDAI